MVSSTLGFDELAAEVTTRSSKPINGAVGSAINKSGKLFFTRAVGRVDMDPNAKPMNIDNIFWLASCSKFHLSICALQCVERGLITLDEPIASYVPELADPDVIVLDKNAEKGYRLERAKSPITLRLLLTHTSGVGYPFYESLRLWEKETAGEAEIEKRKKTIIDETGIENLATPLVFSPGTSWGYGAGVEVAALIVSRLTGLSTSDYAQKNIFGPLNLTSTYFAPKLAHRPDLQARIPTAFRRQKDGTIVKFPFTFAQSSTTSLFTTVPEFLIILHDLIRDTPTLLKKETIESAFFTPHIPADSPAIPSLLSGRTLPPYPPVSKSEINHSLCGIFRTPYSTTFPPGTVGWGGMGNMKWWANRELGVAAVFGVQFLPCSDRTTIELGSAFFKAAMDQFKQEVGWDGKIGDDEVWDSEFVGEAGIILEDG